LQDEPTTALDVTVQNYPVVERHSARNGNEYHIYFHDLSLVSAIAHRVVVMYQGEQEQNKFFKNPQHNYTKALIASPSLDFD
jgi:peptide/nickel transport system ATP-binding protein